MITCSSSSSTASVLVVTSVLMLTKVEVENVLLLLKVNVLLVLPVDKEATDVGGVLVMGVVTVGVVKASVVGGALVGSAASPVVVWPALGPMVVVWRLMKQNIHLKIILHMHNGWPNGFTFHREEGAIGRPFIVAK